MLLSLPFFLLLFFLSLPLGLGYWALGQGSQLLMYSPKLEKKKESRREVGKTCKIEQFKRTGKKWGQARTGRGILVNRIVSDEYLFL